MADYLLQKQNEISCFGLLSLCILLIADAVLWHYFRTRASSVSFFIGLFDIAACVVLYVNYREFKHYQNYVRGRDAEELIAMRLNELPSEYVVIKNVVLKEKSGNIDFVVVGPTGVFALEVKSHRGYITEDRGKLRRRSGFFEKDFIKQTQYEALSLHDAIKEAIGKDIFITPVVVFENRLAFLRFGMRPVPGTSVYAINGLWLCDFLKRPNRTWNGPENVKKISSYLNEISRSPHGNGIVKMSFV